MPTTSNFGWTTPADTDLVKDGAAAIRTLGNGIDTSLVDLKGGTTGQVLSKASNTDLDFSWVAQDDSNAIQNALLTTTGDTIYASGASTPARLGIGTAGQVLTVNSGATAPEWATPSGYNPTFISNTTLSGSSVTISGISGSSYGTLIIQYVNAQSSSNNSAFNFTINGTTSGYVGQSESTAWSTSVPLRNIGTSDSQATIVIQNVKATSGSKWISLTAYSSSIPLLFLGAGSLPLSAAITSLTFNGSATLSGTITLLGI